ncbi:MAG TPA: hemagglutinin repeat-containing protein [Rhodocyclaceae bacterium]
MEQFKQGTIRDRPSLNPRGNSPRHHKQPLPRLFLCLLSALHLIQAFAAVPPLSELHCSGRPYRVAAEFHCGGLPSTTVPEANAPPSDPSGSDFGVSISVGSSHSRRDSSSSQTQVRGTNLQASDIAVTATEGDLTMSAAKLQAQTVDLVAAKDILLQAAANTAQLQSSNQSGSAGVGVTIGFGQQTGISFQIGASQAKGRANGSETQWDNTRITATDTLSLWSGADTTLKGAQLAANTVWMDVGGKLEVETLQDRSNYQSQQSSSGFALSICVPPFCFGSYVTGSVNAANQHIDHHYQSAVGQSGIAAGQGGFDIAVGGNTELKGAAITSTATADKNRLQTASLTSTDLTNQQSTQSSSSSIAFGYGGQSAMTTAANNLAGNVLANLQGQAGLPKDGNEQSQTQSVISPATITLTSGDAATDAQSRQTVATLTSRDANTANGSLKNTLTLQQAQALEAEQKRKQENLLAAQLIGAVVTNAIGDLAVSRQRTLQAEENARAAAAGETPKVITAWGDGSPEKLALHGLAGLIEAKIAGTGAGAGVAAAVANEALVTSMADYLKSHGYDYEAPGLTDTERATRKSEFNALMQLGSTLLGVAVGTLASGNVQGAATGASVASIATTNNYLKHAEIKRVEALQGCAKAGNAQSQKELWGLAQKSEERDKLLNDCVGSDSTICNQARQEVRDAYAEILLSGARQLRETGQLPSSDLYTQEATNTARMADGTLSESARNIGLAKGVQQFVSGIVSGGTDLVKAIAGDTSNDKKLAEFFKGVGETLQSPFATSREMEAARLETMAYAVQNGDAELLGKMTGKEWASYLVPLAAGKAVELIASRVTGGIGLLTGTRTIIPPSSDAATDLPPDLVPVGA